MSSSMERERALGKKREGPGSLNGRRGPELKKEAERRKKRRLILSDSESEDCSDDKTVAEETKVELKSRLGSEAVKQREEADIYKKDSVVGSEARENGVDSLIKEEIVVDRAIGNAAIQASENAMLSSDAGGDKGTDYMHKSIEKDIVVESNGCSSPGVDIKRDKDGNNDMAGVLLMKEKNSIDCFSSKEEVKVELHTASRLEADTKSEELRIKAAGSGSMLKDSSFDRPGKHNLVMDVSKPLKLKVAVEKEVDTEKKFSLIFHSDQKVNGATNKIKVNADQLSSAEESKVKTDKVLKLKVAKEREEATSGKRSSASSGVNQRESDSSSRVRNNSDPLNRKWNKKIESKNCLNSIVAKARESPEKKGTQLGSERKRSREAADDEISLKKLRAESVRCKQEQNMEIGATNLRRKSLKSGDIENPGSRSVSSVSRLRNEPAEEKFRRQLNQKNEVKTENGCKLIVRSSARALRKLKDNRTSLCSPRRDIVDTCRHKGITVQGKSGVLRVLPSNKKVAGIERVHVQREVRDHSKMTENSPSLSKERRAERVVTSSKPGKHHLIPEKVTSVEGTRFSNGKTGTSSLKVKLNKVDSSNTQTFPKVEGQSCSKSNASAMSELSINDEAGERPSVVKQKVRDQIKRILLNAGWKIELKPRRGRAYEDAVYVPPSGGSGYWSITKAYNVYVTKGRASSVNLDEYSTGDDKGDKGATFETVPAEMLKLLTRNVVNKRGSGKAATKATEKLGKRKKGKGILKLKGSKNNDGRSNAKSVNKGGKARKKLNSYADNTNSRVHKPHLRARKKNSKGCALLVRGSNQDGNTDDDEDGYEPYIWKRTILSWMIDLGVLHLDGKVKYMNRKQTRALLEGSVTRDGIRCGCCSKIISVSKFEIHAGSKLQQPYENIFVEDTGMSLLQCQLNAWDMQQDSERKSFYRVDIEGDDPNDDTCGICGDGGDLICCDSCPSTFHLTCLGIQMLPPGDWHCSNCSCRYCGLVLDTLPHESSSATSTLLTCLQCDKRYHEKCIPEEDTFVGSDDSDKSFCGKSCKMTFKRLHEFLGTKNDLEAGLSWTLVRHFGADSSGHPSSQPQRAECNSKIAVAFSVMDECFRPIVDHRSGINLIHNVVFNCGSNINRLSYTGFYTFILERGDEIIAVASVRVHGTRLAEMPFIGTRNMYRRQGMCTQLLRGIESALHSLRVEQLIIPAISELTGTWTGVFGFKPLDLSQRQDVRSINILVFPGTGLLHKPILDKGRGEGCTTTENEHTNETENKHSVIPTCEPTACCSAQELVPAKHEGICAEPVLERTESVNTSLRPELQAPLCNSPDTAPCVDASVGLKVDQHSLAAEDTNSDVWIACKLPLKSTSRGNRGEESEDQGDHAVDGTLSGEDVIEHPHLLQGGEESSPSPMT